jgi:TPR repeat protein
LSVIYEHGVPDVEKDPEKAMEKLCLALEQTYPRAVARHGEQLFQAGRCIEALTVYRKLAVRESWLQTTV